MLFKKIRPQVSSVYMLVKEKKRKKIFIYIFHSTAESAPAGSRVRSAKGVAGGLARGYRA